MTESLARSSARRPFVVIAIWAVVALIAGGLAVDAEMAPGPKRKPLTDFLDKTTATEFRLSSSADSERAERLPKDRLRGPKPVTEFVIVHSESRTVDTPEFRAKAEAVHADIASLGPDIVTPLPNYSQTGDPTLVSSKDRMTTMMPLVTSSTGGSSSSYELDLFGRTYGPVFCAHPFLNAIALTLLLFPISPSSDNMGFLGYLGYICP